METSEVLYAAADLIEERGWAKGNCGMAVTGPMCVEGAIAAVLETPTAIYGCEKAVPDDLERGHVFYDYTRELQESAAYRAVLAYLERRAGASLFSWNDRQETAAEVIATLRAAAVIEAAKENADAREPVTAP